MFSAHFQMFRVDGVAVVDSEEVEVVEGDDGVHVFGTEEGVFLFPENRLGRREGRRKGGKAGKGG
jgi:hypothetical protein